MYEEQIAQMQGWVEEDMALAAAKRKSSETIANQVVAIQYISGVVPEEAERARLVAQAAELEQAGDADAAGAATLEAAAEGWKTIIAALNKQAGNVEDPDA